MRRNIFFFAILFFSSCLKDFEDVSWDANILAPVLKSSLTIHDVIKDTALETGKGDSVFFVYSDLLSSLSLDSSLLAMEVNPFIRNIKLDSIKLNDQHIQESVTLGEILDGTFYEFLIPDESSTTIPSISDLEIGPFEVDGSRYFQRVVLEEGIMVIVVTNNFPVTVGIDSIHYEMKNRSSGNIVYKGYFPEVPPGETRSDTVDMAGKEVEGLMDITFTADIPGTSEPVLIDYSDAIDISISIRNMRILEAYAVFPSQVIINHKEVVPLENMEDRRVDYAFIQGGRLRIRVISTIEEETYFTYMIPNATRNGQIFREEITCPPAPAGGSIQEEFIYKFDGYDFDFTGKTGDTVNAFYNEVLGRIDSTGNQVFLTLEDSVDLIVEVLEIQPSMATGYFGSDTFTVSSGTTSFSLFDKFNIDSLSFSGSNISVTIENSQGIEGAIYIDELSAVNSSTMQSLSLDCSKLPLPFPVSKPDNLTPLIASKSTLYINDWNANPSRLISLLPDKILYGINIITNTGGYTGNLDDFIYSGNKVDVSINARVPLQFQTPGIKLKDTIQWLSENISGQDRVKDGKLNLIVENGFPVEAGVALYFLDDKKEVLDSLVSQSVILSAPVDPVNYMVIEKQSSEISFLVSEKRLPGLLDADNIVVEITLKTQPGQTHLQFFDSYALDLVVVGDFTYHVKKVDL